MGNCNGSWFSNFEKVESKKSDSPLHASALVQRDKKKEREWEQNFAGS